MRSGTRDRAGHVAKSSFADLRVLPSETGMDSLTYKSDPPLSDEELHDLFADAWDGYEPQPFVNILSRSLRYITCWADERLVGIVNVAWDGDKHAFILDTTVRRSHQRQGIGSGLVRRAAEFALARGAEWLHVDFEPRLLGFYRACGFRDTAAGVMRLK
jgi:GNAT superfamily N-acetyltransferase